MKSTWLFHEALLIRRNIEYTSRDLMRDETYNRSIT
jgi:hypothetical protein